MELTLPKNLWDNKIQFSKMITTTCYTLAKYCANKSRHEDTEDKPHKNIARNKFYTGDLHFEGI